MSSQRNKSILLYLTFAGYFLVTANTVLAFTGNDSDIFYSNYKQDSHKQYAPPLVISESIPIIIVDQFTGDSEIQSIMLHDSSNIYLVTQDDEFIQVHPQNIIGIPSGFTRFQLNEYFSEHAWLQLSRFDNGEYIVRSYLRSYGGMKQRNEQQNKSDEMEIENDPQNNLSPDQEQENKKIEEFLEEYYGDGYLGGNAELASLAQEHNVEITVYQPLQIKKNGTCDITVFAVPGKPFKPENNYTRNITLWLDEEGYSFYNADTGPKSSSNSKKDKNVFYAVLAAINQGTAPREEEVKELKEKIIHNSKGKVIDKFKAILKAKDAVELKKTIMDIQSISHRLLSKVLEYRQKIIEKKVTQPQFALNEKIEFNFGTNSFAEFRKSNSLFVDKSLFIKEIIDNTASNKNLLITRPRRWGKTLALSMLKHFLSTPQAIKDDPFDGSKINEAIDRYGNKITDKYRGQVPVIYLDLKDTRGDNYEKIFNGIKSAVSRTFQEHEYLYKGMIVQQINDLGGQSNPQKESEVLLDDLTGLISNANKDREPEFRLKIRENILKFKRYLDKNINEQDLKESLDFLSILLHKYHGKKVYILIDEYDTPVNNLLSKNIKVFLSQECEDKTNKSNLIKCMKDIMELITSIISPCVKPSANQNEVVDRVIITGIYDALVKTANSGLNNIEVLDIFKNSAINQYFGLTEKEARELISNMFKYISPDATEQLISNIRSWYDGYFDPNSADGLGIYNVWSVMHYLDGIYRPYEKARRLSMDGRHKPGNHWVNTGSDDILKNLATLNLNSDLTNDLHGVASRKKSKILGYKKGFNLYDYDYFNSDRLNEIVSYLLANSGYLTSGEKGGYCIPNNEVAEDFNNKVLTKWLKSELKETNIDKLTGIAKKLSDNLFNAYEVTKVVTDEILSQIPPGDKNESYFEMLIGGMIEHYYLQHKELAKYMVLPQKIVDKGKGKIDNIFLLNQEGDQENQDVEYPQAIIHEYKKIDDTTMTSVDDMTENALWQIFIKNYISEPLSKYRFYKGDKQKWKIEIRSVVFCKNNNDTWSMEMNPYLFDYDQAKRVYNFFNGLDLKVKNDLSEKVSKKTREKARLELLKKQDVKSIMELIEKLRDPGSKSDKSGLSQDIKKLDISVEKSTITKQPQKGQMTLDNYFQPKIKTEKEADKRKYSDIQNIATKIIPIDKKKAVLNKKKDMNEGRDNFIKLNLPLKRFEFLTQISRRYIEAIRNSVPHGGEILWGGDIELQEIARIHRLSIVIHQPGNLTYSVSSADWNREIHLWLNNGHYENYDPKTKKTISVPGDGNCLFTAVLRAINVANNINRISTSEDSDVSDLRNSVADSLEDLVERIERREQVIREGTAETNWQSIPVALTQNDDPIRSRFAAIFEAENNEQLSFAMESLPQSSLLDEALDIRRDELEAAKCKQLSPSTEEQNKNMQDLSKIIKNFMSIFLSTYSVKKPF